jgi:hypothetical protein
LYFLDSQHRESGGAKLGDVGGAKLGDVGGAKLGEAGGAKLGGGLEMVREDWDGLGTGDIGDLGRGRGDMGDLGRGTGGDRGELYGEDNKNGEGVSGGGGEEGDGVSQSLGESSIFSKFCNKF